MRRLLVPGLLAFLAVVAPPAAAQIRVEGGATGQPLDQFDTFVSTYNTTYASRLGAARLSGLDRMAGGYGAVRFFGRANGVSLSVGAAYSAIGTTASVRADDGSVRSFRLAATEATMELAAGGRLLHALIDVGGRKTKLLAVYADARGVSDGGDPAVCRRTGRRDCLSGDYRDAPIVVRAGLGARLPVGRTGFGLAASARYPVHAQTFNAVKPGLQYSYYDVSNDKDRCLYETYGACHTQFPRSLDPATPADGNYVSGVLKGVVVRVGLTYDLKLNT